ncbi:MAG: ferritin-like domain-containing protein [Rhizobiaceae bacterium]
MLETSEISPFNHGSLEEMATEALLASDLDAKIKITQDAAKAWYQRCLSLNSAKRTRQVERPGRPDKPVLMPPNKVPKRRLGSESGRIALIHAICHIELNAIDLALDIVARFCREPMPRSFFDDWMMVAREEAKHFSLLRERLKELDADYGDLPAHDGLWEAAHATGHDLTARLALVPLVLEARGLDVTPSLIRTLQKEGDDKTAEIFEIIYEDEKGHVAVGAKWFRFLCRRDNLDPDQQFRLLVRKNFRGQLKPPFNDRARCASGITPGFYRSISSLGN